MAKLQCVAESALETGAFSLLLKLYERLVLGEDVARMCQVMIWSGQVHDKLHECTLVLMRKACRKTGMILVQSVQQAVVQPCFVCSALLNVRREFYCAFLLIFSYQHITLVKAIGFNTNLVLYKQKSSCLKVCVLFAALNLYCSLRKLAMG